MSSQKSSLWRDLYCKCAPVLTFENVCQWTALLDLLEVALDKAHTHAHTHTRTHAHAHTHTDTHTITHTHTHTHTRARARTKTDRHKPRCVQAAPAAEAGAGA